MPPTALLLSGERITDAGQIIVCGARCPAGTGRELSPAFDWVQASDPNLAHCDVCFDQFADGEILSMLWTFRVDDEETIEVFPSRSHDDGCDSPDWTPPRITPSLIFTSPVFRN